MCCTVRVGVLGFQGAFAEHEYNLTRAFHNLEKSQSDTFKTVSMEIVNVRKPQDVPGLDGLILPGGESTTMSKFLERNNFLDVLRTWLKGDTSRRPVVWRPVIWGTCAGLILLADRVLDMKIGGQVTIGGLHITADRNIYGRQRESFETTLTLHDKDLFDTSGGDQGEPQTCPGVFIRAPGIDSIDGDDVEILATMGEERTKVVAVKQDNLMVTAFHPELTDDLRWHSFFLKDIVKKALLRCGKEGDMRISV